VNSTTKTMGAFIAAVYIGDAPSILCHKSFVSMNQVLINALTGQVRLTVWRPHSGNGSVFQTEPLPGLCSSGGGGHGAEEFRVGLRFGEAAEQELHGFDGRERA